MAAALSGLSEALSVYLMEHGVREALPLERLRLATGELAQADWRISPAQGQFLGMLAQISGARRCIEIGAFTGYGTLWLALSLPENGEIISCDISNEFVALGQPFWEEAGVTKKIDLRIAPAIETLDALLVEGGAGQFDMIFIDADKENYPAYYERSVELVRSEGLILVDNVFWRGAVIDDANQKRSTCAIRALNAQLRDDDRVSIAMIPIGDGLTIARKH